MGQRFGGVGHPMFVAVTGPAAVRRTGSRARSASIGLESQDGLTLSSPSGKIVGAMGTSYRAQVAVAFEILAEGLAPFVDSRMSATFPGDDWILMAAGKLGKRRDVLVSLSDPHFQLEVMNRWWGPAFSGRLSDGRPGPHRRAAHVPQPLGPSRSGPPARPRRRPVGRAERRGAAAGDRLGRGGPHGRPAGAAALGVGAGGRPRAGVHRERGRAAAAGELKEEHDELQRQLAAAREAAQSASGRSRAVSRQLAELQTQYAAVAGLRDQYLVLQRQLEEEREKREAVLDDTTTVRQQLDAAEAAIAALQNQSRHPERAAQRGPPARWPPSTRSTPRSASAGSG